MRHLFIISLFVWSTTYGQVRLRVDRTVSFQTIENFAASDAWSCQFVGRWPDPAKNAVADWLFSMDTLADGNPKGIGLSLWRVNLGAGSTEQGEKSGIRDAWRRAAEIGAADGQLWFLQAAQRRGVRQFLGFLNSPPVHLTRNGKAFAAGGVSNIDSAKYSALGDYIAAEIGRVKAATGISFDFISPVNEPQWDWSDGGQEGNPYTNREIAAVVRTLNHSLEQAGLPTKILVTESGHLKYLLPANDKHNRNDQTAFFFDPASPGYIGNLLHVKQTIAGHSYFSTSPWQKGIALRGALAAKIDSLRRLRKGPRNLSFWQSEYCILGENEGVINGSGKDTAMEGALYMARVIHNDLVVGNASAWQWWLAVSPYNYKDGLVYVDKRETGGQYSDSRRLWALGNYSRFVRPGMLRVKAELTDADGLFVSAYADKHSRQLVMVVINESHQPQQVAFTGKSVTTYTTSMGENLVKRVFPAEAIQISEQSITTLISTY